MLVDVIRRIVSTMPPDPTLFWFEPAGEHIPSSKNGATWHSWTEIADTIEVDELIRAYYVRINGQVYCAEPKLMLEPIPKKAGTNIDDFNNYKLVPVQEMADYRWVDRIKEGYKNKK